MAIDDRLTTVYYSDIANEHSQPKENQMNVGKLKLQAANGRHIRTATVVYRKDGKQLIFMERISNREALKQASYARENSWS